MNWIIKIVLIWNQLIEPLHESQKCLRLSSIPRNEKESPEYYSDNPEVYSKSKDYGKI